MPNVDHVQTLELQEIKREKDQLLQQVIQMNQQINSYKHQIETLEGEKSKLFKLNPSSIQLATSTNPLKELVKKCLI